MRELRYPVVNTVLSIYLKVFEDNSEAFEIAKVYKYRPRIKHLTVKLHHFRSYVESEAITIYPINTSNQLARYFTKPVNKQTLFICRSKCLGGESLRGVQ